MKNNRKLIFNNSGTSTTLCILTILVTAVNLLSLSHHISIGTEIIAISQGPARLLKHSSILVCAATKPYVSLCYFSGTN